MKLYFLGLIAFSFIFIVVASGLYVVSTSTPSDSYQAPKEFTNLADLYNPTFHLVVPEIEGYEYEWARGEGLMYFLNVNHTSVKVFKFTGGVNGTDPLLRYIWDTNYDTTHNPHTSFALEVTPPKIVFEKHLKFVEGDNSTGINGNDAKFLVYQYPNDHPIVILTQDNYFGSQIEAHATQTMWTSNMNYLSLVYDGVESTEDYEGALRVLSWFSWQSQQKMNDLHAEGY